MSKIFKYELEITDKQNIKMPERSKVLSVQSQRENLCMWVQVSETSKEVEKVFYIVGTGHPFNSNKMLYIDSVQKGGFVWHIFEKKIDG